MPPTPVVFIPALSDGRLQGHAAQSLRWRSSWSLDNQRFSYHRAYPLTAEIQGYEDSDLMRPVSAARRFQALHAASTIAS